MLSRKRKKDLSDSDASNDESINEAFESMHIDDKKNIPSSQERKFSSTKHEQKRRKLQQLHDARVQIQIHGKE